MDKAIRLIPLVALFLLPGCVPSLHPLYTDKTVTFDERLIGKWSPDDDNESWTFSRKDDRSYLLVYTDNADAQGVFTAHLVKVDDQLFLDLYPEDPQIRGNDFYKVHFIAVHTFMHVAEIAPVLRMAPMSPEWIKKLLAKEPAVVRHEKVEDGIMLTAGPEELQTFVHKHTGNKDAFGDFSELKRRADVTPEPAPK